MRSHSKLILFFLLASVGFSGLTCSQAPPPSAVGETSAEKGGAAIEYPPMPSNIIQTEMRLLDDSTMRLEQKKGTVMLVNLWATWCAPCIKEMPELVALQDELKGSGFEVLGLNIDDEEKGKVESFSKDMKLNYPVGWTGEGQLNAFMKLSGREGIPQSFLIGRDGRLRGVFYSADVREVAKLKETVRKVVKE